MKSISKFGMLMFIVSGAFCSFIESTYALSGSIRVHYANSYTKPTYDYAKTHGEAMGYNVYQYQNKDNSLVLHQLSSSDVFVIHTRGSGGLIQMAPEQYPASGTNARTTYLSGTNGNGDNVRSVSSLPSGSLSNLKLAIYYGMDVGYTGSTYGDICQQTVNKGAQAAVAWKGVMVTSEANEWNRLFFEKAKTDNIVESFRHADYWLRYTMSEDAATRMGSSNRNEKGNIYGVIHQ